MAFYWPGNNDFFQRISPLCRRRRACWARYRAENSGQIDIIIMKLYATANVFLIVFHFSANFSLQTSRKCSTSLQSSAIQPWLFIVNCCTSTCYAPFGLGIDLFFGFLQSQISALKTIVFQVVIYSRTSIIRTPIIRHLY